MITLDEIRNARFQDLFFVTLVKEYTWEEVEEYPISIEGLPSEITVNSILKIALWMNPKSKLSEIALEKIADDIKRRILSCLNETICTIVLKKDNEYFDLAIMEMVDTTKFKLKYMVPFSKYSSEKGFSVENYGDKGISFCVKEGIFEKYADEIEKYNPGWIKV